MSNIEELPYSSEVLQHLEKVINLILEYKLKGLDCIVLFGSYARMEHKAGSDFDILILTNTEVDRHTRGDICSVLDEHNTDIVFYTIQQFTKSDCLLVNQIKKEGVILWKN